MPTRFETSLRERWRRLVARHAEAQPQDCRRGNERHYIGFGSARLWFEEQGVRQERTGNLLNVSDGGLMLKQYKEIPIGVTLTLEVLIGDEALQVRGRTAHCTQTLGGYKVGVELEFDD